MKVVRVRPAEWPKRIEVENTLEALQTEVDGYIEVVAQDGDWAVICDEEGLLKRKPFNCFVRGVRFVGTILFVGVDGEEFTDLPERIAELLCPTKDAV